MIEPKKCHSNLFKAKNLTIKLTSLKRHIPNMKIESRFIWGGGIDESIRYGNIR